MSSLFRLTIFTFALVTVIPSVAWAQLSDSPWIASSDIRIPADTNDQITIGPLGCPVLIVNRDVWHIKSKKVVQTLPADAEIGEYRCLSANGKYFAAYEGRNREEGKDVAVWDLVTGEKVATLPGRQRIFFPVLKIMYNRYLLAAPYSGESLYVWDIEQNKLTREFRVSAPRIEEGKLTVSPDGQWVALVEGDMVSILNLAEGKYAGKLFPPIDDPTSNFPRPLGANRIKDIEFSPDGHEIAALYDQLSKQRLVVWDDKGQVQIDVHLNLDYFRLNEHSLSWLPDKRGWIVDGNVIQRDSQLVTTEFQRPRFDYDEIGVLDSYFVLGRLGKEADSITMIGIPWEEVDRSLEAMKTPDNCIVGPNVQFSLVVYMRGQTGEGIEKARQKIGDQIVEKLKEYKMSYAPDQNITVRFNPEPATKEDPYGRIQLAILVEGSDTPIWEHTLSSSEAFTFLKALDTGEVTEASVSSLLSRINQIQMPYFIPKTADYLPLPLVVQ
ncbi:hypothetical protein GC197_17975 [bacterium]|nr:hypothetical protein [bacterium]